MNAHKKALKLRHQGFSYNYISKKTSLAKSTLSYSLRDIPYTPNKETIKTIGLARARAGEVRSKAKRETLRFAKKMAKKDIGTLSKRDIFMLGVGLYIGEGSKTQDIIRMVNSDYRVINLFIRWLLDMNFSKENFVIRVHLYPDSNLKEAQLFWQKKTGLPFSQFQKPCIDYRVGKNRKKNKKNVHGTAHVTVRSNGDKSKGVLFSRRIGAWMEKVLK